MTKHCLPFHILFDVNKLIGADKRHVLATEASRCHSATPLQPLNSVDCMNTHAQCECELFALTAYILYSILAIRSSTFTRSSMSNECSHEGIDNGNNLNDNFHICPGFKYMHALNHR